ncbi:MAG: galactose mutarotase [Treponema sp.]|nr:galactose mutarotase [Treponema sp.]
MKVTKQKFGLLSDGTKINLYTIKNDNMSFSCTEYGCTITSIVLNNSDGTKTDVIVGFPTFEAFINNRSFFGAIIGRFGNRIGNASFSVNGIKYKTDANEGKNTLHSGSDGFDKMIWKAKVIKSKHYCGVKFSRTSPDGEQGFPGNVNFEINYLLDNKNNLTCYYTAVTDKETPVNITNHAFFNLAGTGSVENHVLQMNSAYTLDIDKGLIPTGKLLPVDGTAFDFNKPKTIGKDIKETGVGYDHCYVTEMYNPENPQCAMPLSCDDLVEFATVTDPSTGHEMSVYTNMEGCQFFTANFFNGIKLKNGVSYPNHGAFCLETQAFPDTPNKKEFPSCNLKPGQKMKAKTVYSFKI